jgi:hypothetical protein
VIEVFDLGILANDFKFVATIHQYEIWQKAMEYVNKNNQYLKNHYKSEKEKITEAAPHKIVKIVPITFSQSKDRHLMCLTSSSLRIYLEFKFSDCALPSEL